MERTFMKKVVTGLLGSALLLGVSGSAHALFVTGYAWCEPHLKASGQYEIECTPVSPGGGGKDGPNLPGTDDPNYSGMAVLGATYGRNCGATYNNAVGKLGDACNGEMVCDYVVDYRVLGDPTPGCAKDLQVSYYCAGKPKGLIHRVAYVAPEAGFGSVVHLTCQ
jgi:hypothetical protein